MGVSIDRVDVVIASMRQKKLGSRYDKRKMANAKGKPLNLWFNELDDEELKSIILSVRKEKFFPTLELIRQEIINAVEMIFNHHNYDYNVLSHNCCFEAYIGRIKKALEIILTKEWVYSHSLVKEVIEGDK